MNQAIHVVHDLRDGPSLPSRWEDAVARDGIRVLRATPGPQVETMLQSPSILAVLVELGSEWTDATRRVKAIAAVEEVHPFLLLGIQREPIPPDAQAALARSGLQGILPIDGPPEFLLQPIRVRKALSTLMNYESSGISAQALAMASRKILHDISQPLTALQGRLQILEAKTADADPLKPRIRELTHYALKTTALLADLHDLNRRYS